jgi:hypothetical protein
MLLRLSRVRWNSMRFFAMVEWEEKKQNQVALRTLVEE